MEAQGGAGSPDETKKGQKLLKPSSSEELSKESSHHSRVPEEDRVIPGHTPSLLHVTDRRRDFREPLSSVSSLEVHFDMLDLTELTDMSDQELAEVFVDSDEENPESPARLSAGVSITTAAFSNPTHQLKRSGCLTAVIGDKAEETLTTHCFHHHLSRSYLRSPSWTRCSKLEQSHDRKHHSDSDSTESDHKLERPKKP